MYVLGKYHRASVAWYCIRSHLSVCMSVCLSCSCSNLWKPWSRNFWLAGYAFRISRFPSSLMPVPVQSSRLPGKTRLRNDLICVEWDVKPYRKVQSHVLSHLIICQGHWVNGGLHFWISLSLSLFAQSEIRTEQKLNQKVKSIFLFGLSPNFGLSERLS